MKQAALFVTLLVLVILGTGFLVLIWIDMRSSHESRSTQFPARDHVALQPKHSAEQPPNSTYGPEGRTKSKETCSSLGVSCASQYFGPWAWPADSSCHATMHDGFPEPDAQCTPGGVVPDVTADTLRNPSWRTRCIRNCQSSEVQKHATYAWYGLPRPQENSGQNQTCELDHLVPLELGGADGMGNIWPECGPADVILKERYFKQKDLVENYLAAKVRSGDMSIGEAQRGIASDWVQFLKVARVHCRLHAARQQNR